MEAQFTQPRLNQPPNCAMVPVSDAASPERSRREMRELGIALKEWLEVYKRNQIKEASYARLLTSYQLMMHFSICNIAVAEVTTLDVQRYINRLVEKGYARTTVLKQYRLLTAYYAYAARERLIDFSPVLSVAMPKEEAVQKKRRVPEAYTVPQQKKLMAVLTTGSRPEYDAIVLMLETGMRIGEALALTWRDINWDRRAATISKTVIRQRDGTCKVQESPKSESSNRTIPLSVRALTMLERRYEDASSDEAPVFAAPETEDIVTYNAMKYYTVKACKEAGIPYRGTHVFRHTFATNCYHKGCDVKLLSKMLGHSSAAITYNVYIHLYGDALEDMRGIVG